ncbi:MAG TPA: GlsB/YeaQ/YmgE family stress response membrane protein [Abditibacteriaceae bacterium]|jgi:uncharacterized membrane protein YeaQ/YmgE (transglycosylase-associated protein family)
MSGVDFLLMLVVAAVIGAIGGMVGGYSSGGCLMSIVAGFIGAFIGRFLRDLLNLPTFWVVRVGGAQFPIIWSILGAAIFVIVLRFVQHRRAL